jgi:hypothetical protein
MDACEQLQPGQVDHLSSHRRGTTQDKLSTSPAIGVADLHQEPDENRAYKSDVTQVDVDGAGTAIDELSGRETERPAVPQIDVPLDLNAVHRTVRRSRDGQPHLVLRVDRHTRPVLASPGAPEVRAGKGLLPRCLSYPAPADLVAVTS